MNKEIKKSEWLAAFVITATVCFVEVPVGGFLFAEKSAAALFYAVRMSNAFCNS